MNRHPTDDLIQIHWTLKPCSNSKSNVTHSSQLAFQGAIYLIVFPNSTIVTSGQATRCQANQNKL